jgi:hypothetical protein
VVGHGSAGKAVVITPSKSTCEALGITRKGAPAHEFIDYLGTEQERGYAYFAKYLDKAQVFSSVDSKIVDHPESAARESGVLRV